MPRELQARFDAKWASLEPLSRAHHFHLPKSGYFSISQTPWDQLLERGGLAVPSTVFGAVRRDFSVVTCLLG